jgi:hypothetical protein
LVADLFVVAERGSVAVQHQHDPPGEQFGIPQRAGHSRTFRGPRRDGPVGQQTRTLAEFEQEFADVVDQTRLQLALADTLCQVEEVEDARVLESLLGEVEVLGRREGEVGDRLAGALVQPSVDLEDEDVARPAVRDRLGRIP